MCIISKGQTPSLSDAFSLVNLLFLTIALWLAIQAANNHGSLGV